MEQIEINDRSGKRIGGVKLINGGFKGLEVSYETVEVTDKTSYINEHTDKRHRPVHRDLKKYVQALKDSFLELLGYPVDDERRIMAEVTGIKAGIDKFVITGKMRCWEDKVMGMATPAIKEVDNYDSFAAVMDLVDKIYKEVDLYMKGEKKVTRQEVIVDYVREVKHNEKFDYADFEKMSEDDRNALMNELQEELGITIEEEDGQAVVAFKDTEAVPVEQVTVFDEDHSDMQEPKPNFDDDDMPLPVALKKPLKKV